MFTVVLPSVMCKISRPNKSQSLDCDFAIFVARYITYLHHSSFYQKHRLSFHIVTPLVTINHYNPLGYVSEAILQLNSLFTIEPYTTIAIHSWRYKSRLACQSLSVLVFCCIKYAMHATCVPVRFGPGADLPAGSVGSCVPLSALTPHGTQTIHQYTRWHGTNFCNGLRFQASHPLATPASSTRPSVRLCIPPMHPSPWPSHISLYKPPQFFSRHVSYR